MNSTIPATAGFNDKIASGIFSGLKKIPYLKNKLSTPKGEKVTKKVINIAIEVFKALGIVLMGAIFGALVGVNFGGPWPIVISAVVGGLSAGIAYFAAKSVMFIISKYGYPNSSFLKEKAISSDTWLDDKHTDTFNKTLDTFKNEDWFKNWLTLKNYKKCNNFLRRRFQKGFCHGETQALLDLIKTKPDMDSKTLLDSIEAKNIFRKQILEIIRADFASILKKEKKSVIKGLKRKDLKKQLATLTSTTNAIAGTKKYPACHFDKAKMCSYSQFKQHFKAYTDQLKGKHPHFAGTIRLESKNRVHTLFVQYEKGHYRIYDGYNTRHTGFYEFPDKAAFLKGVHKHLRSYARVPTLTFKRYNNASIQFYGF